MSSVESCGSCSESGTLRNHAEAVLADAYAEARRQAADETELDLSVFPVENVWGLDEALGEADASKARRLIHRPIL